MVMPWEEGLKSHWLVIFELQRPMLKWRSPEAKVGLLPCAGGTQNLTWLVGEGWAKRIILCGERVSASLGLEIGLVEEVVASGQGLEVAMKLAGLCCQSVSLISDRV